MNNSFVWKGRFDGDGLNDRRLFQVINDKKYSSHSAKFGLLGFKSDEGVKRNLGRTGSRDAPEAIRTQIANFPIHNEFYIADFGNIECFNENLEKAQFQLATKVHEILDKNIIPIVLGGGHETAFGSFLGLFNFINEKSINDKIGIINFDAHFDLRKATLNTSGTPFLNAAKHCKSHNKAFNYMCLGISKYSNTKTLFETADNLNVTYLLDSELQLDRISIAMDKIEQFLNNIEHIYISIDLDFFPSYVTPGVSAPAIRGVNLDVFELLFSKILSSNKVRLLDIVECLPEKDIDNRTSKLAAFIAFKFINELIAKEPL